MPGVWRRTKILSVSFSLGFLAMAMAPMRARMAFMAPMVVHMVATATMTARTTATMTARTTATMAAAGGEEAGGARAGARAGARVNIAAKRAMIVYIPNYIKG